MNKVFITGEIPTEGLEMLQEHFEVEVFEGSINYERYFTSKVTDVEAIISPLSTNIDKEIIDQAPNLKIIANYGAGFNNIDVKYAREKD